MVIFALFHLSWLLYVAHHCKWNSLRFVSNSTPPPLAPRPRWKLVILLLLATCHNVLLYPFHQKKITENFAVGKGLLCKTQLTVTDGDSVHNGVDCHGVFFAALSVTLACVYSVPVHTLHSFFPHRPQGSARYVLNFVPG